MAQDANAPPSLAIAFAHGLLQLMRSDTDERPILIDTAMAIRNIRWNPSGTSLAVSGHHIDTRDGSESPSLAFYSSAGKPLRTMRVPGGGVASMAWDGGGVRMALAVDSSLFFASVRPDYKYGYFSNTLVYAFSKQAIEHFPLDSTLQINFTS